MIEKMKASRATYTVLQCTSACPCPAEKVGINLLEVLSSRYGCPVGLSEHAGTIHAGLAAATLGANVVDVHVTPSREMFGPDVPVSITTDELRQLMEGVKFIEKMRANPVYKDAVAGELLPMCALFTKSVVTREALPAGTMLKLTHLTVKKPGSDIPGSLLERVVACRTRSDLPADHVLRKQDLEGWNP